MSTTTKLRSKFLAGIALQNLDPLKESESLCAQAILFELGADRKPCLKEATKYWRKAAALGSAIAEKRLSHLESKGLITNQDRPNKSQSVIDSNISIDGKVLIISPDYQHVENYELHLTQYGIKAVKARDGIDAIKKIRAYPEIVAIITEFDLSTLNKTDLLQILGKNNHLKCITIASNQNNHGGIIDDKHITTKYEINRTDKHSNIESIVTSTLAEIQKEISK